MVFRSKKGEGPGEIFRLEIPLTLSIVLILAVVALTVMYAWWDDARGPIKFFGAAAGVAAGVLSAFYIGRALKVTIEQRDHQLIERKIEKAFEFAHRWNDPSFAEFRSDWRRVLQELQKANPNQVCNILEDAEKRTVVADVLNFFEVMGYAVRSGVADLTTLQKIFRRMVEDYYAAVQPWIDHRRREKAHPTLYEHFEWLRNQWK